MNATYQRRTTRDSRGNEWCRGGLDLRSRLTEHGRSLGRSGERIACRECGKLVTLTNGPYPLYWVMTPRHKVAK